MKIDVRDNAWAGWSKDAERIPLRGWLVNFETIPPIFLCQSPVAVVMQGVGGQGRIDRIGDAGQPRRLR